MSTTDSTPSPIPASGFRARVLAREQLFGTFLFMGGMGPAEIAARSGLDWVLIDMEHAPNGLESVVAELHAVSAFPVTPVVRVPIGDVVTIKQVLDLGAQSIVVPMVSTVVNGVKRMPFTLG